MQDLLLELPERPVDLARGRRPLVVRERRLLARRELQLLRLQGLQKALRLKKKRAGHPAKGEGCHLSPG